MAGGGKASVPKNIEGAAREAPGPVLDPIGGKEEFERGLGFGAEAESDPSEWGGGSVMPALAPDAV